MSVFTVYKTTNLLNSRYYLGVHETSKPNDEYLGSGIAIKRAVKKYGEHNFRKDVLFEFIVEAEAYAKEVELLKLARRDSLCYNLHEGGKGGFRYINEAGLSDPSRAGRIAKEKGTTGRPKGSKDTYAPITTDKRLLCMYDCGQPARFLVGKKENPCCSSHHGSCPAYRNQKNKMRSKRIKEGQPEVLCVYECGKPAEFLLGSHQKPCCSKTFYDCSGHWRNLKTFDDPEMKAKAEATMLRKYGVVNAIQNEGILAKRDATNLARYGSRTPMTNLEVNRKRIRTNRQRYGGNAPACDPAIAAKIHKKKALSGSLLGESREA